MTKKKRFRVPNGTPLKERIKARTLVVKRNWSTPCHEWQGALHKFNGYALIADDKHVVHIGARLVWMTDVGPIPEGHSVARKCKNPICIRRTHLYTCPTARLMPRAFTDEEVLAIRLDTRIYKEIAKTFGVNTKTIQQVKCGDTYCDLPGPTGRRAFWLPYAVQKKIANDPRRYEDIKKQYGCNVKTIGNIRKRFGKPPRAVFPAFNGLPILDPDKVRVIRTSSESASALARRYGVTPKTISMVLRGVTWNHVI